MFSMCLGKNGGYFQMGGYDKTGHIGKDEKERDPKWVKLLYRNTDFKVPLRGMKINNIDMPDTKT